MVDWDAFERTVEKAHDDVFDFPDVDVYNYENGYEPSTGKTSWDEVYEGAFPIEMTSPTDPRLVTGPDGQDVRVRFLGFVRSDAGFAIRAVGDEPHRPTELEYDGSRYVVAESHDEGNGLVRLVLVKS